MRWERRVYVRQRSEREREEGEEEDCMVGIKQPGWQQERGREEEH